MLAIHNLGDEHIRKLRGTELGLVLSASRALVGSHEFVADVGDHQRMIVNHIMIAGAIVIRVKRKGELQRDSSAFAKALQALFTKTSDLEIVLRFGERWNRRAWLSAHLYAEVSKNKAAISRTSFLMIEVLIKTFHNTTSKVWDDDDKTKRLCRLFVWFMFVMWPLRQTREGSVVRPLLGGKAHMQARDLVSLMEDMLRRTPSDLPANEIYAWANSTLILSGNSSIVRELDEFVQAAPAVAGMEAARLISLHNWIVEWDWLSMNGGGALACFNTPRSMLRNAIRNAKRIRASLDFSRIRFRLRKENRAFFLPRDSALCRNLFGEMVLALLAHKFGRWPDTDGDDEYTDGDSDSDSDSEDLDCCDEDPLVRTVLAAAAGASVEHALAMMQHVNADPESFLDTFARIITPEYMQFIALVVAAKLTQHGAAAATCTDVALFFAENEARLREAHWLNSLPRVPKQDASREVASEVCDLRIGSLPRRVFDAVDHLL